MKEEYESSSDVKKLHFASINKRIQDKYADMQRKLARTQSIECLQTIVPNTNIEDKRKLASTSDLRNYGAVLHETDFIIRKQRAIVEEVKLSSASLEEINVLFKNEAIIESSETNYPENFRNSSTISENEYQNSDTFDSVYDDDCFEEKRLKPQLSPTKPVKLTMRERYRLYAERDKEKVKKKVELKEHRISADKSVFSKSKKMDNLKLVKKIKTATVTITLIDANGIEAQTHEQKARRLHCRFKLGNEKFKSKLVKRFSKRVCWLELLSLNLYDDTVLEVSLWDKDILLGKSNLDLAKIKQEKTHKIHFKLDELPEIEIFMLITITGTASTNMIIELDDYTKIQKSAVSMKDKFDWHNWKDKSDDVGFLSVIVYGARGLSASDCFCILQLDNDRLLTQTESKTTDPTWMKSFTFTVQDITSFLEVTVHDEKKSEDVGKISIALLSICNGLKKWYALKDINLREKAKGNDARILLEMRLYWNLLKASTRVINPREEVYLTNDVKLDKNIFARNLTRAKIVVAWILDAFKVLKTLFEWESRRLNVIALSLWILLCVSFRIWMVPLMLLIPFVWYKPQKYTVIDWTKLFRRLKLLDAIQVSENDGIDDDENEKEGKTSLRQKLNSLQEMVLSVQSFIGDVASLGESIKNLFNFTVPYLSFLAIFLVMAITTFMFIIPLKYILIAWGFHKFTRKILRPNRIANNEIMDLLSRVPDDVKLLDCEEIPLETNEDDL